MDVQQRHAARRRLPEALRRLSKALEPAELGLLVHVHVVVVVVVVAAHHRKLVAKLVANVATIAACQGLLARSRLRLRDWRSAAHASNMPARASSPSARINRLTAVEEGEGLAARKARVRSVGLVVLLDAALDFGHCRFYEFDLQLETCSSGGCGMQTPCRLVGKWDW